MLRPGKGLITFVDATSSHHDLANHRLKRACDASASRLDKGHWGKHESMYSHCPAEYHPGGSLYQMQRTEAQALKGSLPSQAAFDKLGRSHSMARRLPFVNMAAGTKCIPQTKELGS